MSTNDRSRLVNSELGDQGTKYLFTGNGMPFSTKVLKDIGVDGFSKLISTSVHLVCCQKEIDNENNRIDEELNLLNKENTKYKEFQDRKSNIKKWVMNIEDFAKEMKSIGSIIPPKENKSEQETFNFDK